MPLTPQQRRWIEHIRAEWEPDDGIGCFYSASRKHFVIVRGTPIVNILRGEAEWVVLARMQEGEFEG